MHIRSNVSIMTANLYNMCKIKLHKTSKCLWPVYTDIFFVKWMFFFGVFLNHFPKIHRSVLRKITIDPLYFWDIYDVNLWEKNFERKTAYLWRPNIFIQFHHSKQKYRLQYRCFPVDLVKLSRTEVVASENT